MRHRLFFSLLFMGLAVTAHGQPPSTSHVTALPRAPVIISVSVGQNDRVGALLLQSLRSRLVVSKRLSLAPDKANTGLSLHLVTLNPVKDSSATVYSETFTLRSPGQPEQYIFSTVAVCGTDRVTDCAKGMEDELTRVVDMLIQAVRQQPKPVLSAEIYTAWVQ